jgi:hypothetical protein
MGSALTIVEGVLHEREICRRKIGQVALRAEINSFRATNFSRATGRCIRAIGFWRRRIVRHCVTV